MIDNSFLKRQAVFCVLLIGFTLLLFAIQWYVIHYFYENTRFTLPLWTIYAFHFISVLIVYTAVNYRKSKKKEVFSLFMGATLVKMILAIIFLLPVLINDVPNAKSDVLNFFIPYFLFLIFEVANITTFLKEK